MGKSLTTISVSKRTHNLLKNMGKKGEPYDDILVRLIEKAEGKIPLQIDTRVGRSSGRSTEATPTMEDWRINDHRDI